MPSDFESGTRKTIDITLKAEKLTADVLKAALQEFVSGRAEKIGRMTYGQLQKISYSKLDEVVISDQNIGDFLKTARKYDIDYALKKDSGTETPTWHVFFSAAKTEDFKRAFTEYLAPGKSGTKDRSEFTREEMQKTAERAALKQRKYRQRQKTREKVL